VPRYEPRSQDSTELAAIIDQELAGLPDKLRAAVLLCQIQGRTRREAARELGVAEGTVASRVARGRVLLAMRLARHGLSASAVTLATAFTSEAVSASLVAATVKPHWARPQLGRSPCWHKE
jgi:hypothetical protein